MRTPSAPDTRASTKAGVGTVVVSDVLIAKSHVACRQPALDNPRSILESAVAVAQRVLSGRLDGIPG